MAEEALEYLSVICPAMGAVDITYVSTSDLETGDDSVTLLDLGNSRSNFVDNTAELVAENVSLLHLYYGTVKQMKIATADSATGNLEDDILVFDDLGLRAVDWGISVSRLQISVYKC